MTIYFMIPVYNEAPNIETLFNSLESVLQQENKFYLFIDDGSTDNTIDLINRNFNDISYHIIEKEENYGPGHSFNIGFEWVFERYNIKTDIVVTMEADNTSDINILPNMVNISKLGYELVLASVYAQGGGFEKTSFFRKFLSFFANIVFRSFFGIKVLTLTSFYRVYQPGLLNRIKENYNPIIKEKGFICMLEILMKAIKVDASIIEVPMILKYDRREGNSKIKIIKNGISYFMYLFFSKV